MKLVIKIGGAALDDKATVHKCAEAIVRLASENNQIAVVHGGGGALTRVLQRAGKQTEFVSGLRITDAETRDYALMVLAGLVNKNLVAAIGKAGIPGIGLSGGDGLSFRACKKKTPNFDLGYVGEICSFDARWIEAIWKEGGIPVLCSLALGSDGEYYNVNADEAAAACAAACGADSLIFLTDVAGVKDAAGAVLPILNTSEVKTLIATSVIAGGMLPKLQACSQALNHGVERVRILPAAQVEFLPQFSRGELSFGTEVTSA